MKKFNFGYHGSPNIFNKFNTKEVCLAKNINEAKRYGKNIYIVKFKKYLFETKTIYVLNKEEILNIKILK
jgi:hypothetical protein